MRRQPVEPDWENDGLEWHPGRRHFRPGAVSIATHDFPVVNHREANAAGF